MGDPQHGWFIMANPIKMDDLGATHDYFWKLKTMVFVWIIPSN
jgi:hypothetical protein